MKHYRISYWIAALVFCSAVAHPAEQLRPSDLTLLEPRAVQLAGSLGQALDRGIRRLSDPPFSAEWLLADVSFKMDRIFTNYSGDASGRFIELAASTTPAGRLEPQALGPVIDAIAQYQKPDGHFGLEVDLRAPLPKLAPPIPMLWGNARLLVGLVTAARELDRPDLLASARRLGDFYVASAKELCSPDRLAEYKASGSYGDGYTCCYFPAIEGLVLLHTATGDPRYLEQARRMADWFQNFDALPVDHSHGNLCAWRGILELYGVTGERAYLERAMAKWQAAVQGGYVWSLGGIGEHWYVWFEGDEGCSESDWLRFNLDLWRFTRETRYLDMAERLLANQYLQNQCSNGGYGMRHFDGDGSGPIGTRGRVDEWPFCCSFHGPLGLHFLKAYLAAATPEGVYLTFPLAFTAPVKTAGRDWILSVRDPGYRENGEYRVEITLAPKEASSSAQTALWIRVPNWAVDTRCETPGGEVVPGTLDRGYFKIQRAFKADEKLAVFFKTGVRFEGRRFQSTVAQPGRESRLADQTALLGPHVLAVSPAPASGKSLLLATVDARGHLGFPQQANGKYWTVALKGEAPSQGIEAALRSAPPVSLRPWPSVHSLRRVALVSDYWVVPAETISQAMREQFISRLQSAPPVSEGPFYGEHLENRPEAWIGASGWEFLPDELRVRGGEVGLIDGTGYDDYRFEFDLRIPQEGFGIAGWVVRAETESDCLMFQIQTADSTYHAPEFKTRPNTLRPHLRRHGQWTILEPVLLPKEVRRGEVHQLATECRGDQIDVFLDNTRIHSQTAFGLRLGGVGFRAGGPSEEGRFRNIALRKL